MALLAHNGIEASPGANRLGRAIVRGFPYMGHGSNTGKRHKGYRTTLVVYIYPIRDLISVEFNNINSEQILSKIKRVPLHANLDIFDAHLCHAILVLFLTNE
jgi:hypothetical protein